ncbi:MAG: DUF4331 family protein [Candidatus Eremiobacteraeota bacterium]|nr:DUF4331 family protein [Candidatus Eremiobacteraeota bacterium]
MKRLITIACATAVSLAAFSSCSNDPTVSNGGGGTTGANLVFKQIDRVGRPGLKELYLPYANHSAFNMTAPTIDSTVTAPQITTFVTTTAGRSSAIAQYVTDILTPDALLFNVTNTSTTASYLGYESGGQIAASCNGGAPSAFGGRGLSDDVVSVMLGLAFGNLATSTTLTNASATNVSSYSTSATTAVKPPPDDGAEKNGNGGTPLLSNQHLGCTDKVTNSNTFPYLTAPI